MIHFEENVNVETNECQHMRNVANFGGHVSFVRWQAIKIIIKAEEKKKKKSNSSM